MLFKSKAQGVISMSHVRIKMLNQKRLLYLDWQAHLTIEHVLEERLSKLLGENTPIIWVDVDEQIPMDADMVVAVVGYHAFWWNERKVINGIIDCLNWNYYVPTGFTVRAELPNSRTRRTKIVQILKGGKHMVYENKSIK